jgi:peptide/nickel transport system permease protein
MTMTRLRQFPALIVGALIWLSAMVVVSLYAHKLGHYQITAVDLPHRLQPPVLFGGSAAHLLGTDTLGRDVMARLLLSIRVSLTIALGATALSALIGTALGLAAAHFRGVVEQVVLMLIDFQASMPFLIVALALLGFLGNSLPLFAVLMGFYGWERHARIARALALSATSEGYVLAIRQLGAGPMRLYFTHVLPNIAAALIVSASLGFPEIVLMESGLSFLGLGVQAPFTSLGAMVGAGREHIATAPWLVLAPSVAIVMTTLSISLIGDWLRDRMDPALR